jgi:ribosomal protein S18 acetylase RimI-like enzyme
VNELYVSPAHRGTGVADDLLSAAVGVARRQDLPLDRLLLDVDPDDARAAGFYERHGFEPWGGIVARPLRES